MLQENKVYTLSEFCKILRESQEFDAKKGKNVDSENKKNNEKAVKEILNQGKDFDGGLSDKSNRKENPRDTTDFNKTTLEVDFAVEPSDEYKARVKAQVHGFPSADNEKNTKIKDNKSLDFEGNEKIYDDIADKAKKRDDAEEKLKTSGLVSSKIAEEDDEIFKNKGLFKENRKMKRLNFSKTVFLDESQMIKKIPDDMRVDGNKFYMRDSVGNEYLVECVRDKVVKDYIHANVLNYENKQKMNESFERMKQLYSYKSSDNNTRSSINENLNVGKMISESKDKLIKKSETNSDRILKNLISE